jgi:hypothetical protein
MTTSDKVSIWLASQSDLTQDLTYAERQNLKDGGHSAIAAAHMAKLRRQIRSLHFSSGAIASVLVVAGLLSWASEFGLLELSTGSRPGMNLGTLLILGAGAVFGLFRANALQKRCTLYESAQELDAFFETRAASRSNNGGISG